MICSKRPFKRNLLKNHSGELGVQKHWKIVSYEKRRWTVENPPAGVSALPDTEPIFKGNSYCFATSGHNCIKQQIIDLATEGLSSFLLDKFQPPIVVKTIILEERLINTYVPLPLTLVGRAMRVVPGFFLLT